MVAEFRLFHDSTTFGFQIVVLCCFMCMQVAFKVNAAAGDGTTTAIILAREIIKYGLLAITSGANPIGMKRGMEKTVNELIRILKERSIPVVGKDHIKGICLSD